MISFKTPRKRFLFIVDEPLFCCNPSIRLEVPKPSLKLPEQKAIGRIKFMNIDYSRLGHRSRGLAAVSQQRKEKFCERNFNSESLMPNRGEDKFHSRFFFLLLSYGKQSLKLDSPESDFVVFFFIREKSRSIHRSVSREQGNFSSMVVAIPFCTYKFQSDTRSTSEKKKKQLKKSIKCRTLIWLV